MLEKVSKAGEKIEALAQGERRQNKISARGQEDVLD